MRNVHRQTIKNDLFVIFVCFCANPVCVIGRTGPKVCYSEKARGLPQIPKKICTEAHKDHEEEERPGRNISVGV